MNMRRVQQAVAPVPARGGGRSIWAAVLPPAVVVPGATLLIAATCFLFASDGPTTAPAPPAETNAAAPASSQVAGAARGRASTDIDATGSIERPGPEAGLFDDDPGKAFQPLPLRGTLGTP